MGYQVDKYFTPNIEDIRIGYECELNKGMLPGLSEGWHLFKFENVDQIALLSQYKISAITRVPYLTKEQIEAEGWEFEHGFNNITEHYEKEIDKDSHYSLVISSENQIVITKAYRDGWTWKWNPFYAGECRDINTLRYICKLLNIS